MEELSIYNLTITSDHRLKVNNEEVGGDGSILPGDSESLLAWALIQVGYIQQDSDSNMALQIEDQRPEGYGVQKVTIPPGKRVLIEALRKRTGRDLSYITEEAQQRHAEAESASAQSAPSAPEAPADTEQWDDSWGVAAETPAPTQDAPEPHESAPEPESAPEAQDEASDGAWTQEMPRVHEAEDDVPTLAPPPSLDEFPETPAQAPQEAASRPRQKAYEQTLPEPAEEVTLDNSGRFPEDWGNFDGPPPQEPVQAEDEDVPPLPPFAPGASPDDGGVTEHESLSAQPVTYKRNRPELGEDEVAKTSKGKKQKKPRSKPMMAALIVVSLIAAFLLIQVVRSHGENSYVATCIDERTMVRQASIDGCKNEDASYYRWWYTPNGSEVPAVNQTVAQDQGTRIRPDEATIREDYDAQGGVYGDDGS